MVDQTNQVSVLFVLPGDSVPPIHDLKVFILGELGRTEGTVRNAFPPGTPLIVPVLDYSDSTFTVLGSPAGFRYVCYTSQPADAGRKVNVYDGRKYNGRR